MLKVEKLKFQSTSFFQLQRGDHTFSASKGGVRGKSYFQRGDFFQLQSTWECLWKLGLKR